MLPGPKPLLDESQWVIRIRNILEEQEESEEGNDNLFPSIAGVPKPLLSAKPEAYIPQLIALGPYHHDKEELREMERYKLSAAKRIQIRLPSTKFRHLVDLFVKVEFRIRAHYQRYLHFNGETLAWMMAIDASFLLEFLQVYAPVNYDPTDIFLRISSSLAPLMVGSSGVRKSTHDMLMRDIMVLENQIPLFLLNKILQVQFSLPNIAEDVFKSMLIGLLKEVTPFKSFAKLQSIDIKQNSHLLELLYHSIIPPSSSSNEVVALDTDAATEANIYSGDQQNKCYKFTRHVLTETKLLVMTRGRALVLFLIKIPWSIITLIIPAFAIIKQPIENIVLSRGANEDQTSIHGLQFEEIAIPSVTELVSAGIQFEPTKGDVSSVSFDANTATLYLPKISLDVNSEVVIRNLVAFETAIESGPLILTRYVELMNGIIDTDEDAKLLRERGIVVNGLRCDNEVAELWNGMSPSVRMTRVPFLDEVIEGVNSYYNGKWKVKVGRFIERYVVCTWNSWVLMIVFMFLTLVGFQAFSIGAKSLGLG